MRTDLLIKTNDGLLSTGVLLLRLTIGYILFVAGAGKVLGWFGGFGPETTLGFYAKSGFTPFWAYMSMYTEFIGGFLVGIGLLTRPAAFAVMINMFVAFCVTLPKGFLKGGASYPFSLMIIAVVILLAGPMRCSIDAFIFKRNRVTDG